MIMTVRMPMARSSSKRSVMPGLTMSLSCTTPRQAAPVAVASATTSGVPPARETSSTVSSTTEGTAPPCSVTQRRTASAAPLRIFRSGRSMPDMRVVAENGTRTASVGGAGRVAAKRSSASVTIERPSGVSSASDDSRATSARCSSVTPGAGWKAVAWRLPMVIVPVLSNSSVETSPAASTARPDMASTLRCTRRSMPAMPMADSRPPIVVGIRQTSRAISTMMCCSASE